MSYDDWFPTSYTSSWTVLDGIGLIGRYLHLPSKYRPISLKSILVKIMERIIHRQLIATLEHHNTLDDCQFGFRHKRSTVSLLLEAVNDWALSLENRNSTHCVILDLAKAFDSVSHP